jgi:rhodanese-related sulfurtransferase
VRAVVVPLLVLAGLLASAAPAAEPDYPVSFISVDELKAALDRGVKADVIDVRHQEAYVDMHITGAWSMPLPSVPARAREIRKSGLVVFY